MRGGGGAPGEKGPAGSRHPALALGVGPLGAGLPYLSRIPIVGSLLFGRTYDSTVRTELLVLLKPRVVRTPDDAQAVTDELRAKIRSVRPITDGRMP